MLYPGRPTFEEYLTTDPHAQKRVLKMAYGFRMSKDFKT